MAALPVGGRDGTLEHRFVGTRAAGNVHAKTGSIANVRALSGYVTSLDGETFVFSMIANHFTVPQSAIDAATDRAVERLARFLADTRHDWTDTGTTTLILRSGDLAILQSGRGLVAGRAALGFRLSTLGGVRPEACRP